MYNQQPDPDDTLLLIYILFSAVEVVVPILLLIMFIWLVWKVISLLAHALSPDGGLSRREQAHRHRLENMAALMTFAAFITGGVMLLYGEDSIVTGKIILPGGIEMENVGLPTVLLGFATSILWVLLKAKAKSSYQSPSMSFSGPASAAPRNGFNKPRVKIRPEPAFPDAGGKATQPNSASKTDHIILPPSSLSAELQRLMDIDRALINNKDTITASAALREWKRRVSTLTRSDDIYKIEADDGRKGGGMYGELRNTIQKCRRYVEALLPAPSP